MNIIKDHKLMFRGVPLITMVYTEEERQILRAFFHSTTVFLSFYSDELKELSVLEMVHLLCELYTYDIVSFYKGSIIGYMYAMERRTPGVLF